MIYNIQKWQADFIPDVGQNPVAKQSFRC